MKNIKSVLKNWTILCNHKKMRKQKINVYKSLGVSVLIIFTAIFFVKAWDAPTTSPPGGNVPPPINVSTVAQSKEGALAVGALGVRGAARIDGRIHLDGNTSATNYISGESPGIRIRTEDDVSFYTGGWNHRLRISSDGNIGIGTTSPGSRLDVRGNISTTGGFFYSSDERFKEDIENLILKDEFKDLKAISYIDKESGKEMLGFSAQEVEKIYPQLVAERNGDKILDYGRLTAPILELLKSQNEKIENQQSEIKRLSKEIEKIKKMIQE